MNMNVYSGTHFLLLFRNTKVQYEIIKNASKKTECRRGDF